MPSTEEYLNYILEQLSGLDGLTYRAMMGEYILYYKGKIAGGIYDDRLLIKPVQAAVSYMSKAVYELPYAGGSKMLLVEDTDDAEYLKELFEVIYEQLPEPKKKKKQLNE